MIADPEITAMSNPFDARVYAKSRLVEMVMAIHGRSSPDPVAYRRMLNGMGTAALQRALDEPPDFPAVSLTENAGVIASADKGTVPGSSRDVFSTTDKH